MLFRFRRDVGWQMSWLRGPFALVLSSVVFAVLTGAGLGHWTVVHGQSAVNGSEPPIVEAAVLQDSGWLSESYWRRRRQQSIKARSTTPIKPRSIKNGRSNLGLRVNPWAGEGRTAKRRGKGNLRTVCVRLCDGYYFPISFSTNKNRLAKDEKSCRSRCNGGRLFYFNNATGSVDTMRDRRGRRYSNLKSAFVYRTNYMPSCQCRPDPWSDEARQRHAMYRSKKWKKNARRMARREHRRGLKAVRAAAGQARIVSASFQPNDDVNLERVSHVVERPSRTTPTRRTGRKSPRIVRGRMSLGQRVPTAKRRSLYRPKPVRRHKRSWRRQVLSGRSE